MDQSDLANALVELTGSLRPVPATSEAGLQAARQAVARALAGGQPADSMYAGTVVMPASLSAAPAQGAGGLLTEMQKLVATSLPPSGAPDDETPEPFALLRTMPLLSPLDPTQPEWARGLVADKTFGPFLRPDGQPVWIDLFPTVKLIPFVRGPGNQPFALFPVDINNPANTPRHFVLGRGSAWIVSRQLLASSPMNGLVGLRIKSGAIDLDSNSQVINQVVHLAPNAVCKVTLQLDPPPAPPATTGPGVDATHAVANLPTSASFQFAPTGGQLTSLPDFSGMMYGTTVQLKRNVQPPAYDSKLNLLLFSCDVTPAHYTASGAQSQLFKPSLSAPVLGGAWALIVTVSSVPHLGQAQGTGLIGVNLGPGIHAQWTGLAAPVEFSATSIYTMPGALGVAGHRKSTNLVETFQLWSETPGGGGVRRSSLDFQFGSPFTLLYLSQVGQEQVLGKGAATAHLDRPVHVDATRFSLQAPNADLQIAWTSSGQQLSVTGSIPVPLQPQPIPFDLENVLLNLLPPNSLSVTGTLQGASVQSGTATATFDVLSILPTLPDPYAADFPSAPSTTFDRLLGTPRGKSPTPVAGNQAVGSIGATTTWPSPDKPQFGAAASFTAIPSITGTNGATASSMALLDLSSNADQCGVLSFTRQPSDITTNGLTLDTVGQTGIFTVPEISWEPMFIDPNDPNQAPAPNPPPNDGTPTVVLVPITQPAPIEPTPLAGLLVKQVQAGMQLDAYFTLPFGLQAEAHIPNLVQNSGAIELVQPTFGPTSKGGLQIAIVPPNPTQDNAFFPGTTTAGSTTAPISYGASVLKQDIAAIFNADFQNVGVPVRRIDFSGYGASMFSEWKNPTVTGTGIIKVQFDVVVGRTAYEVVVAQSYLYPWGVRVVRTITIERLSGGSVFRHDSGWQAATPGLLLNLPTDTPGDFDNHVHPGAVLGVTNVRNIRVVNPLDPLVTIANIVYSPVLFDAEVEISGDVPIVGGGGSAGGVGFVTSQNMVGFVQIQRIPPLPPPDPGGIPQIPPLARSDLANLLAATGPLGGLVACTVDVGASGFKLNAVSAVVSISDTTPDAMVVGELRGTPILPRQGAWSMARQMMGQTAPAPLDPNFAVPLVRNFADPTKTWHMAEAADISQLNSPQTQYGLLQSTGTQKIFFATPQVQQGTQNVNIPQPPLLADIGALLNATGIFPDLTSALKFPGSQSLPVSGGDLTLPAQDFPITAPAKTLLDLGTVKVLINYQDENQNATQAHVEISSSSWTITLARLSLDLIITAFGSDPLLRVFGAAQASSTSAPTLTALNIVYGDTFLKPVTDIFQRLQFLGKFLPGGAGAGLNVTFSQGSLSVSEVFAIPDLPLGIGDITDVALDLGASMQLSSQSLRFTAGIGSQAKPFHWIVSPLAGTGVIQVGATNGNLTLLIQGGLGLGLGIDVGIASGSASVVLAAQVDNTTATPFAITGLLTGQASVDVLDGLASLSLTLSAGMGIAPAQVTPPNVSPHDIQMPQVDIILIASVGVSIHLSICWVVDVDFDGFWQFKQEIDTPKLDVPLP